MENRKDYEKRLGERLEAAYMQEDIGPVMSREEFHRLIQTAEKKKRRRRTMLSLAAACVALCLVCGGFLAGMTMRESASAGKDDETKTVQQGGSVVIGSGVSENDQNVGVSTKTYTNIEDIPEDIRKEILIIQKNQLTFDKIIISQSSRITEHSFIYRDEKGREVLINKTETNKDGIDGRITVSGDTKWNYNGLDINVRVVDDGTLYTYIDNGTKVSIILPKDTKIKIEAILNGLTNF